jgi:S-DNA-T family DNA segregation ATPase FtsK/SpoIIIE
MKISKANEIKSIFLLTIALVIFISLLTFDRNDIRFLTSDPNLSKNNVIGSVGAYLAWVCLFLTGFSAYAIPIFIAMWGAAFFLEEKAKKPFLRVFGATFSVVAISSIFSLIGPEAIIYRFRRGGITGLVFSDFLLKYLGTVGAFIVIFVLFLLSFLIMTDFLIFPFIGWLPRLFKSLLKGAKSVSSIPAAVKARLPRESRRVEASVKERIADVKVNEVKKQPVKAEKKPVKPPKAKEPVVYTTPYKLPSTDLLNSPPPIEEREIKEDLAAKSKILEETLSDFGIEGKVVNVDKGPVITRYELEPARGVTINKITSLSDNIALAMKAVSIRVVAPIPGKGTVGVEVPNSKSTFVYLREILESKKYKNTASKLKLVLGKDISGVPIVADLDDMPHLLIAGATGSGKTVCVNSIIMTLLFNASPEELKFLMVDPKQVELADFNNLPHLLGPVVKDTKKVSHTLNWLANEMDRRFEMFSEVGVRNINVYNKERKSKDLPVLPYIILIIDELNDLMLVARQEVEDIITRIAQLSRAVGIHMIIATQRPSVNVITGVIKANLPARISFKVASKVDSRTVIDMNGAEKLLGKGDLLFIEPGNPKPVRAQGALINDDEIKKVVSFIKAQRKPDFAEEIVKIEEKPIYKRFEKDEVYEEAVKLVLRTKQASVSMLQRRLGVGYTRAARLIDMMEDEGIVGSYQGSKPREILVDNIDTANEKS